MRRGSFAEAGPEAAAVNPGDPGIPGDSFL